MKPDILERFMQMSPADQQRAVHVARMTELRRHVVLLLRYHGRPCGVCEIVSALSKHFETAGVNAVAALDDFAHDRRRPRLRWAHGARLALSESRDGVGRP